VFAGNQARNYASDASDGGDTSDLDLDDEDWD
jgi:hypothetical protein